MRRSRFLLLFLLFQSFMLASEPNTDINDQSPIENSATLSQEESFKQKEQLRRTLFFGNQALLSRPDLLFRTILHKEPHPYAIPLDGQAGKDSKNYLLYTDQFYRFLLQSDSVVSHLFVKVHQHGQIVHEERIAIPPKKTLAWDRYLTDGQVFIPETKLTTQFGLDLRLTIIPDPNTPFSLVIAQKANLTNYQFSFSVDDNPPILLYGFNLVEPPPWQLGELCKPSFSNFDRPFAKSPCKISPFVEESSKSVDYGLQTEHFPVLDQFVNELKKDPIALAQFVYNEITLVDPFLRYENGAFQAPKIHRTAFTTFLEKQGSPWEQCMLLVYLLRQAGYKAVYAHGDPCSLPKAFVEKLLFTQLLSEENDAFLKYPWVLVFDGKEWISLFPWMKEMQINEGFDLYNLMPEEYASADRWIHHYLCNDNKILQHIGADKDDTVAVLFVRFVEEELKKQGLSLADVGIHRTLIKKEFTSWADFPRPCINGKPQILSRLSNERDLFAQAAICISARGNPNLSFHLHPFVAALNCNPYLISFSVDEQNNSNLQIGPSNEMDLDLPPPLHLTFGGIIGIGLLPTDYIIDIKVVYDGQSEQTFSITKGTTAALYFHCGGASPKTTSLFHEKFAQETKEEMRLHALLSYIGAAYFEKCCRGEQILANLHKVLPTTIFAAGFAKLSPDFKGTSNLKFPQVDMFWFNQKKFPNSQSIAWHQEMHTAFKQFSSLTNADQSSNEHQILKEIFDDQYAISTVKLLQLAHLEHQKKNLPGPGFLAFNNSSLAAADKTPEAAQTLYFSHLKELDLRAVKAASPGQWDMTKSILNPDYPLSDFAYAYMTPGVISSQKAESQTTSTYREMGTLIFHPYSQYGLISNGSLVQNGGLGSPLAPAFVNTQPSQWELIPTNYEAYVLKPSRSTFSPDTNKSLPPLKKWSSDVRPGHMPIGQIVSDPVDVVSGAFYIDDIDLTLPGPFPLEIRRNYNSQNPITGQLGCGWKLSLNPYLIEQDGKLYAAEEDGTVIVYRYSTEKSRWIVHAEDNPALRNFGSTANPFNAYIENNILYGPDGSKRIFENNRLTEWINAAGNTLTFVYENNRLSSIKSSHGGFLGFRYNSEDKISEIYAKDGRIITYSYDFRGDLRRVKLPNDAVISYEYDEAHQITHEKRPHGKLLENRYENGRVKEQLLPLGPQQKMGVSATFKYEDGETTVTDAAGAVTKYKIFQKQIYKTTDPYGHDTLQSWFIDDHSWFDPETEKIVPWDGPGGWQRSLKSSKDKRGLTTYYIYDRRGNTEEIGLIGNDLTGSGETRIAKKCKHNDQNLSILEETQHQKTVIIYDSRLIYFPKRIEKYAGDVLVSFVEFDYNDAGQIKQENQSGALTIWEYDTHGFPKKKIQKTGTDDPDVITTYDLYNQQGQCTVMTMMDGIQKADFDLMGNKYQSFVYSLEGNLISATYAKYNLNNQLIWKQSANENNFLCLDYLPSGLVKASRQTLTPSNTVAYTLYEYDLCDNLIEEVDPLGHSTIRKNDLLGRPFLVTKMGLSTTFTYESGGLVKTITAPSGAQTVRHYTTNGLLKEEIYPDGTKSTMVYDFFGRPCKETKNGIVWEITYDDAQRKVIRTHLKSGHTEIEQHDARGNLISFTDALGYVWKKTYDNLNRLTSETNPSGEQTTWSYQEATVICTQPSGEKTVTRYEGGQVAEEQVFNAQDNLIAHSMFHYDPKQDIQTITQGDQVTTTWVNTRGQPYLVQKGNLTTAYEYDPAGNRVALIDGEGRTTSQKFDDLDRLILKELPDGTTIKYDYDADSNLKECHLPNGCIWIADYDHMGRKKSEKLQADGQSSQQWVYIYEKGYLKEMTDPLERVHTFHYDDYGRVDQEAVGEWQRNYTYDPRGPLATAEQKKEGTSWFWSNSENSLIKRSFDPSGRLDSEEIYLNSELLQETHQKWRPSGRLLEIGTHQRDFTYQNSQLVKVATDQTEFSYAYNLSSTLIKKTTPLSVIDIHPNAAALPETILMHLPEGSSQETMSWDHSGKLSRYQGNNQQKIFTYHPRGYLKTAGEEAYEFDFGDHGVGIRTAAPHTKVPSDGLDIFGRVQTEISDKGTLTTTYDPMSQVIFQSGKKFDWDPWGRLIKITDANSSWEASYDALGRRLQTRYKAGRSPALTTTSLYDPEEEFGEIGVKYGNKAFWKVYGPNSCDAVSDEAGSSVYLMHNALGHLAGVVSQHGAFYNGQPISAYGPQTPGTIPTDLISYALSLSWHSTGQDLTGLIWMGARYYDPQTGRFLSLDPVGYPINLDLYAYAGGDPVNYFDPDGRCFAQIYQPVKASVINVWNNPRFQGSMQALGGLGEIGAGYAMTFGTGGAAAPIGYLVGVHGVDHFTAGLYTAITGKYKNTATNMALQGAGLSSQAAGLVDCGLGLAGMGAGAWIEANRMATVTQRVSEVARINYGVRQELSKISSQTAKTSPPSNKLTTLYRAVKPEELTDIQKTAIFRNLGDAEGKYFTTSIEGASSYAKKAVKGFGDPPYTLVRTQVPGNIFNGISPTLVDGGIPAWVLHDQSLEGLIPEIMTWMAVPK